jgi:putative (di)nucleoside polyphosphate hydrolase
MTKPHLRAGVVAAVRRSDGRLLAFERSDLSGEWQLPQGGIESGETPEQAAWRELREETGLDAEQVALVEECEGWTAYVWPESMQRGDRLGQAHRWFFFEPIVDPLTPTPDGSEFSSWAWMLPASLIDRVVEFRKQPYRQVLGG